MARITKRALHALRFGQWQSDTIGARGQGSLQARRQDVGIRYYYYRHGPRRLFYPARPRAVQCGQTVWLTIMARSRVERLVQAIDTDWPAP